MRMELSLAADFGPQLADGKRAASYRMTRVEPYLEMCEPVVLDFSGVRSANSSFVNALVAGIVEQHGPAVLQKVSFKGCNPAIRVLVEAAISLGLSPTPAASQRCRPGDANPTRRRIPRTIPRGTNNE